MMCTQKHYRNHKYDYGVIEEIVYRLTIKDKVKELRRIKNLFKSKDGIRSTLMAMNFSNRYIHLALLMYEVMAEMFGVMAKFNEKLYDLEILTELIMRLRSKMLDYEDCISVVETSIGNSLYDFGDSQYGRGMEETELEEMVMEVLENGQDQMEAVDTRKFFGGDIEPNPSGDDEEDDEEEEEEDDEEEERVQNVDTGRMPSISPRYPMSKSRSATTEHRSRSGKEKSTSLEIQNEIQRRKQPESPRIIDDDDDIYYDETDDHDLESALYSD